MNSSAGLFFAQPPYSRLGVAANTWPRQDSGMRSLFIAGTVFVIGAAVLGVFPDTDLISDGVRAVINSMN